MPASLQQNDEIKYLKLSCTREVHSEPYLRLHIEKNTLGMYFFFCFIPYTKLCEALEEYIGWWPSLGITTAILAVITRMIYSKPQSNKKHTNQTTNQQEKPWWREAKSSRRKTKQFSSYFRFPTSHTTVRAVPHTAVPILDTIRDTPPLK